MISVSQGTDTVPPERQLRDWIKQCHERCEALERVREDGVSDSPQIARVEDEKITDVWSRANNLSLLGQLGIVDLPTE